MRHKGYQAEATKCSLTFILRQGFTLILRPHFRADLRGPGNENNIKYTSQVANREGWWQKNFSNRYGRYE